MSDTLTRARQEIDALLASLRSDLDAAAAARAAELDRREAELARAIEHTSQDAAVQAAYRQGQATERRRMRQLIGVQLQHLAPTSGTRTVLHTLARMVEDSE
jgi:peptidoglycan hydrolase CwlO-like protein